MKIRYQINVTDLYDAYYYIHWAAPEKRWFRIKSTVIPLFVLMALFGFDQWVKPNLIANRKQEVGVTLIFILISIASFVFTGSYLRGFFQQRVNKFLLEDNNAKILEPKEINLNNDGLTITNAEAQTQHRWDIITQIREVNGNVYLYLDPVSVMIFRKDMFAHEDEFLYFKNLAKANISVQQA